MHAELHIEVSTDQRLLCIISTWFCLNERNNAPFLSYCHTNEAITWTRDSQIKLKKTDPKTEIYTTNEYVSHKNSLDRQ